MEPHFRSSPIQPTGGYVVARPGKTDTIGGILRSSFLPDIDGIGDEMKRMLERLDSPARPSRSFTARG